MIDNNHQVEPQPNTQPEDNGTAGEKLFTQDEVNRIISERLKRERAKDEPDPIDQRTAELNARENALAIKEFMSEGKYNAVFTEIFDTSNVEIFKANVLKLIDAFPVLDTSKKVPQIVTKMGNSPPSGSNAIARAFKREEY